MNFKNISIHERSVPIDFKHDMIRMEMKKDLKKQTATATFRKTIVDDDDYDDDDDESATESASCSGDEGEEEEEDEETPFAPSESQEL